MALTGVSPCDCFFSSQLRLYNKRYRLTKIMQYRGACFISYFIRWIFHLQVWSYRFRIVKIICLYFVLLFYGLFFFCYDFFHIYFPLLLSIWFAVFLLPLDFSLTLILNVPNSVGRLHLAKTTVADTYNVPIESSYLWIVLVDNDEKRLSCKEKTKIFSVDRYAFVDSSSKEFEQGHHTIIFTLLAKLLVLTLAIYFFCL